MKSIKLTILLSIIILTGFVIGKVYAQESVEEKYGITFPILELNNCKDINECREFCDDPVNNSTCVEFAKQKGFYNEDEINEIKEEALKQAISELGCDSESSCRNYCQQEANIEKCSEFAKRHKLRGGTVEDVDKVDILEKAKEILGCDSKETCVSFCKEEVNRQKCSDFAKATGLRGGEKQIGPGGCTSEETCRVFCSTPDNFKICQSYSQSAGVNFSGPGGCKSEEECKSYCGENLQVCKIRQDEREGSNRYNPPDMCNRTPSCWWAENTCNCKSSSQSRQELDPALECTKYSGCVWSNNSCRCTTAVYTSGTYNPEEHKNSCISGGCTWTGSNCNCAGTNGPAVQCGNKGCTWMNSDCQCNADSLYSSQNGSNKETNENTMNKEQQEYYCKVGGGSCDWSWGYCYCKDYQNKYPAPTSTTTSGGSTNSTTGSTNTSGSNNTGTTNYYNTNTYSREQQETTCKAGGGTCEWSNDICDCKGYTSTGTSTSTSNTGMSREQQESGCSSCGGTCSWNGDMCNCQCSTSTTTTNSQPTDTAPQSIQGEWTRRNWFEQILDMLKNFF